MKWLGRQRDQDPKAQSPGAGRISWDPGLMEQTELSEKEFRVLAGIIRTRCGISLGPNKRPLVKSRLGMRLRALQLGTFSEYIALLDADKSGGEIKILLDSISTNVTSFFRQEDHFRYLREKIIPALDRERRTSECRLRIWSAGCSSGEEPYSVAIELHENLPDLARWDAKILATDISTKVLTIARGGTYPDSRLEGLPPLLRDKYMDRVRIPSGEKAFRMKRALRDMITFGRLNLMGSWPMKGPLDVIFCRNVMIYFDTQTREKLVRRFSGLLRRGGTLFIGHSESLTGIEHELTVAGAATYTKGIGK